MVVPEEDWTREHEGHDVVCYVEEIHTETPMDAA